MYKKISQSGSQITVTTSAVNLATLLKTADPTITDADLQNTDMIDLNPEGDIRYLVGSSPTTAIGMKLASGGYRQLVGVTPGNLYLIASGSTLVNVQIGTKYER